jgi:hypothetical protein
MWEDSLGKSEFDNLAEGGRTLESEVGQHLSIDIYLFLVDSSKKSRVGRSIHSGCSIDAYDPELTEHSLPSSAIAIGILHPFVDVVLRYCKDFTPRSPRSLRLSHDTFPASVRGNFIL